MAKAYDPNTIEPAGFPATVFAPVDRLDYATDHATITEPITVPAPDGEGRCRVLLDYAIRSAVEPIITINSVVLTAVRYGIAVDPPEVGISFAGLPILEFDSSLAGLTGDIQYAPLCSYRSAAYENSIGKELQAVQQKVSDITAKPTIDGYGGANPDQLLIDLCTALDNLGLITFTNP